MKNSTLFLSVSIYKRMTRLPTSVGTRVCAVILALMLLFLTAEVQAGILTSEVWESTKTTFVDGRLVYRRFNVVVAPGIKDTAQLTKRLCIGSMEDFRDTVMKSPETFVIIYDTGIIQNFVQYKGMLNENWNYSKLSLDDFADAKTIYIQEGNWGLLQSAYYVLKGSSRAVWALAILNSGEALYQIGKAGSQTMYYLFRYPVAGIFQGAATPVVFVGGSAWSFVACGVTTGWALPFVVPIDAVMSVGDVL